MKIGEGKQLLQFNLNFQFNSSELNRYLYKLFTPGVLSLTITNSSNSITISDFSGLITPSGLPNTLAKIDILSSINLIDITDITKTELIVRYIWQEIAYDYDVDNIVNFLLVAPNEVLTTDVILGSLIFDGSIKGIDYSTQTKVYLHENCIPYDKLNSNNTWTLEGSDVNSISGYSAVNQSGHIPLNNSGLNFGLNAQYLGASGYSDVGVTAGHMGGTIPILDGIVNENLKAKNLFSGSGIYTVGNNSGCIPLNNNELSKGLKVEYLGGYQDSEYSLSGHIQNLDEINDGEIYKKIYGINSSGYATPNSITDGALKYQHLDDSFRYHSGIPAKTFMVFGKIGLNSSKDVIFKYKFASKPLVFILNNETNDYKTPHGISINGFSINHQNNSMSVGGNLSIDPNKFNCSWIAIGELA
jgi:hypothetical protein